MRYFARIDEKEYEIEILSPTQVLIDGESHQIDFKDLLQGLSYSLLVDGISYEPNILVDNGELEVLVSGSQFSVTVEDERERKLRLASGGSSTQKGKSILTAPMPGLVIEIPVAVGDAVSKGDVLLILESMKMQNELTAPQNGIVSEIKVELNSNVERKEILLVLGSKSTAD